MKKPTPDASPLDIERELDEVVGRYEPHAGERWLARYGRWLGRALLAACLAVAAAVAIIGTLDRNMKDAERDAAAKRPVMVDLLPPR